MLKVCNNSYISFSLLGDSISDEVVAEIEKQAETLLTCPMTGFFVSPQIALHHKLSKRTWVGCISTECGVFFPTGLNLNMVGEKDFRTLVCNSDELVKTIKEMGLNALETVIWLDCWFQKNIQYIKDNRSYCNGQVFVCPEITRQAMITDVFLNHYGTCEDISVSIAVILQRLEIPCEMVGSDGHAWLLVKLDDKFYIWDCTHNITRNEHRLEQALKAERYTSTYTLIGMSNCLGKYADFGELFDVADEAFPRNIINDTVKHLESNHNCCFNYGLFPVYKSFVLDEKQ